MIIQDVHDVVARTRFLTTDEGGRETDVAPQSALGYRPIFFLEGDAEGHSCVILVEAIGGRIALGSRVDVPILFLFPELIKPRLKVGNRFTLWEGHTIANGEIIEISRGNVRQPRKMG